MHPHRVITLSGGGGTTACRKDAPKSPQTPRSFTRNEWSQRGGFDLNPSARVGAAAASIRPMAWKKGGRRGHLDARGSCLAPEGAIPKRGRLKGQKRGRSRSPTASGAPQNIPSMPLRTPRKKLGSGQGRGRRREGSRRQVPVPFFPAIPWEASEGSGTSMTAR